MIRMYECDNKEDDEFFWDKLVEYFKRDLFPDPEDEDRAYFLGKDYEMTAAVLHITALDKLRYFLFERDGEYIGLVMTRIYGREDQRCYLMEFCVFPEYRGGGTGRACALEFIRWAMENDASYIELNACTDQRKRFWRSVGFVDNGLDDYGEPSLMYPPWNWQPFTAAEVTQMEDWQLVKLVNSMRHERGQAPLDDDQRNSMAMELMEFRYGAVAAEHGGRKVGICFLDLRDDAIPVVDTYIEPVFRDMGVEKVLKKGVDEYRAQFLDA